MSNPSIIVHSVEDVQDLKNKLLRNLAENSILSQTAYNQSYMSFLRQLKFEKSMIDPIFEYKTNFIEYLNQTFTYMVMFIATSKLFSLHPTAVFELNLGTRGGYDIISTDKRIICECFASTSPQSNMKLINDTKKVFSDIDATDKYVAFYCVNSNDKYIDSLKNKFKNVTFLTITESEMFP